MTNCPHTGRVCPTPGKCAEPAGCYAQRKPVPQRWPYPLRKDTKPRAVWPAGVLAAVAVSTLVSACGGDSGPDDTTSGTQPVNCTARPELCK